MRRPAVGIIALALATACTIPTETPNWDVIWNLPLPDGGQTISVTSFLPGGVTVVGTAPSQSFQATVSSVPPINQTLGSQCPACPNGTQRKPEFNAPISTTTISLVSGTALNTGTIAAGSAVVVAINNRFNFDPIRPPDTTATGTFALTISNGTTTLGTRILNGATDAIPANQITNVTVPLNIGITLNTAAPITVSMTMFSPAGAAGSPVAMSPSQPFVATATPTINLSQATVTIAAQPFATSPQDIDLADGPIAALENRVADSTTTQGSMFLLITNPMTLGANATVTFAGTKPNDDEDAPEGAPPVPIIPVTKPVVIPAGGPTSGTTTVQVDFTGQELRRILGANLTVSISGNTAAGSTLVTPTSSITIFSRIQVRAYTREFE